MATYLPSTDKKVFTPLFPQNNNEAGDTINLWLGSYWVGRDYYPITIAKGMTVPSTGLNGDLKSKLENLERVGFRYNTRSEGLEQATLYRAADLLNPNGARDACITSGGANISPTPTDETVYFNSYEPQFSDFIYDDVGGTSLFSGGGDWYGISQSRGYVLQISDNGKVLSYCTCSSKNDGYPESDPEPHSAGFFFADVSEILSYPNHYFFAFKDELIIPKLLAPNSSSLLEDVVFYPGVGKEFFLSDFVANENNDEDSRKSKIYLTVDRLGSDAQPTNITFISESLTLVTESRIALPEDVFASIQDSNYETITWTRPRYSGAKSTAIEGELPSAITFIKFSGSVYTKAFTSESIENENSFEGRKVETLYYYKEYDPNASYTGGGSGGTSTYIRVVDEPLTTGSNPSGCPGNSLIRRTTAVMIDGTGAVTTNNSGNTLEVSVKYLLNHVFGTGEINPDIVIAHGDQSGYYEYTSSYQTIPFGEIQCRDINTQYGEPNVNFVVGNDGNTYRVVNASFVPPSETGGVVSGINYILRNRTKGSGLNIIQDAFVLNTAKKEIHELNEDGIITRTKKL